jgi:hypothetical protein
MAKKRLGPPLAPVGPQFDFFVRMQDLVLACGDPSLAEMARAVHVSRQVLHRAFRGPNLPSRDLVARIVEGLMGEEDRTRRAEAKRELLQAWTEAVADDRSPSSNAGRDDLDNEVLVQARGTGVPIARRRLHQAVQVAYEQAGRPPLKTLSMRMLRDSDFGRHVPPSTLSDWLTGKSVPREINAITALNRALVSMSRGTSTIDERWLRQLWEAAADAQATARRRSSPA